MDARCERRGKKPATLREALASSGHDIVLLSGDVHFGRIAGCALGNNGARLIEIISSPLSNLTYLNGIATSKPEFKPKRFPDPSVNISGWSRAAVKYSKDFAVTTRKGQLFSVYPKDRTREHFMTIGFQRKAAGGIKLTAQAWRVRKRAGTKNLPKKDFARAFQSRFELKISAPALTTRIASGVLEHAFMRYRKPGFLICF